jgi:type IV pilus assembly protein PilV
MQERIAVQPISRENNAGFTLIEVVVAMGIIMVGLLGLLEAVGIATGQNLKNQVRDEAVFIGEERMADLVRRPFSLISTTTLKVPSRIRGTDKPFVVERKAVPMSTTDSYEFVVRVGWSYKNMSSHHEVRSMRTYVGGK